MNSKSQRLNLEAQASQLSRLSDFIQKHCADYHEPILIELATNEVIVNSIQHGKATQCRLTLITDEKSYKITIEDDGAVFNPLDAKRQALGELREGGYGLSILDSVSQTMLYDREGDWNRLCLIFSKNKGESS